MQPSEFEAFYCAHSRRLLAFFARRTFDVEVARDLTAETFAQAFEHRRRFRGSSDAEAAAWLFGIAPPSRTCPGTSGTRCACA